MNRPVGDDLISMLIGEFRVADAAQREGASKVLTDAARAVLLHYARDAAVKAVRKSSQQLVGDGLTALALENGLPDARDSIVAVALLFRSSQLLDMDCVQTFKDASALVANPILRDAIKNFPSRSEEERDLKKAFFFTEEMTKDGFTYVWHPEGFVSAAKEAGWKAWFRRLFSFH